jgi:NADH-quinone oxidoreductase subunit L
MYAAAVLLPLLAFLLTAPLAGRLSPRMVNTITITGILLSAVFSARIFFEVALGGVPQTLTLFTWIPAGDLSVAWRLRFDSLSAVMLVVVTSVSAVVHIYSTGYMAHDARRNLFMAYLSLFTFMMLMLVTADNFVQLFFGWEGVGLASYLLIGFWYDRESANAAAMKAFIVNRVGDFGLILGIATIFAVFGSLDFSTVFAAVPEKATATFPFLGYEVHALTLACILLFVGAVGKSAQLGLHVWLPDAMEGPTPVSALIHAATMVTAGVFLLCRVAPMLEAAPYARDIVIFLGAATALFAATVGLTQFDIKRVVAYSTCSQLGYMVFAAGVGAYGAAMFHLFTHAFFKALLFLGAGSVIHAMSDEQDLRRMGGLRKLIPVTYYLMLIGSLALAGVPIFAGYYSKDMVLEVAFAEGSALGVFAYAVGVLVAFLTAFYSWRLLILAFHGTSRTDDKTLAHVHESPPVMLWPMLLLAVGSVLVGYLGYDLFVGEGRVAFWNGAIGTLGEHDIYDKAHHVAAWVKYLPVGAALAGIGAGYVFYAWRPSWPQAISQAFKGVHQFFYNRWYFDHIYNFAFLSGSLRAASTLWRRVDQQAIDNYGPNGVARLSRRVAGQFSAWQTGFIYHYAFVMLIGLTVFLAWYLTRAGS